MTICNQTLGTIVFLRCDLFCFKFKTSLDSSIKKKKKIHLTRSIKIHAKTIFQLCFFGRMHYGFVIFKPRYKSKLRACFSRLLESGGLYTSIEILSSSLETSTENPGSILKI